MENFVYSVPTRIYFGKGQIQNLGTAVREWGGRALLVYGGGSIKKTGLYDTVMRLLKESGVAVTELSGVEPNPKITSVREGVRLCRENGVDVVVPVGGGSTIDCAKVVAAGACYGGDAWDLVIHPEKIGKVLPVVAVLTLAATGTEMNGNAVISDRSKNDKFGTFSQNMKPKASILDPEYTFSVSRKQTAAGTADIMSHIFEAYFNNVPGAFTQSRIAEALLKTCIHYGPVALEQPENYEARANLMWVSSLAINGLIGCGAPVGWTVHPMEHELSAFYDITHGVGLAILTPHWMKYVLNENTVGKFVEYGVNVWGIDAGLDRFEIANRAIAETAAFFKKLGIPATLREVGIGGENLEVMARKSVACMSNGFVPLRAEDVLAIFRAAL